MKWAALVPELSVTNLQRSLDFYLVCGFTVRFRRDDPPFAYLELGDAELMLEERHHAGWQTGSLEPPFGRGVNFQIEVPNAEVILEALGDWPLFRPCRDTWYPTVERAEEGQREFLVQDPDGYLLRFSESLGSRKR